MIKVIIIALALTALVSASYEYCEVYQENPKFFFTHNERRNIDLSNYFRGYNLEYALPTDSPLLTSGKSSIRNPVVEIDSEQFQFDKQGITGLRLLNVDRLITQLGRQSEQGIIVANVEDTVVVARGIFAFGRTLPAINSYKKYKIPNAARCFNGVILNDQYDVAVDCQTESNKNVMCLLTVSSQNPICYQQNPASNENIRAVKSSQRITQAFQLSLTYSYIFSVQTVTGIDPMFANLTTISLYGCKNQTITLLSTINANTFDQENLGITDMKIDYSTRRAYLLSTLKKDEIYSSQLINFQINSEISDIVKIDLKGEARSLHISTTGNFPKSLFVATRTEITEWDANTLSKGKIFQIDPTDNEVTDIQSNYNYLVFTTTQANQYLYRKSSSQQQLMIFLTSKLQLGIDHQIKLSEYVNLHFIFTLQKVSLYDLNFGYLVIEEVADSGETLIFARSGNNVCAVNLMYQFLDNPTSVYSKRSDKSFSETSEEVFTLRLEDYFGGSGLQYNLTFNSSNRDIEHKINTITKYKFADALPAFDVYRAIAVDENSFYMAGTNNATNQLHVYKCLINDNLIKCENKVYDINDTISCMDGVKKRNGDVVFFYAFKNSKGVFQSLNARNGAKGSYISMPQYFDIDTLHVTQQFIFAFYKKQNAITFFGVDQPGFGQISASSFTDNQLLQLKGFYPKELFDDPTNPNVIYIRTVTGVVCLSISKPDLMSRHFVSIVKNWDVFGDWQPDSSRAVVMGQQTYILIENNVITQFSVDEEQPLHTIDLREDLKMPLAYRLDASTQTVTIMTENNNIFMIRMNQASSDSIIGVVKNYNGSSWSCSGGWHIFPTFQQAIWVPTSSNLQIISNLEDEQLKVLLNFNILVKGFDDKNSIAQNFAVEIINYKKTINPSPKDFTLSLPKSANGDQFEIPIDTFFDGPVSKYTLNCVYCNDGRLTLVTPIRQMPGKPKLNQINDMVLGTPNNFHDNLQSDVGDFNESIVVILDGNTLNIVNTDNQLLHTVVFAPKKLTTCSKVGVAHIQDSTYTILVLCSSPSQQQILRFQYDQMSDPKLNKIYTITDQRFYINNPSSIEMTKFNNGFSWVFIHDKDPFVKTSEGNVKIFLMNDNSPLLSYNSIINGKAFGLEESTESINGFHIHNSDRVAFAIGRIGIGYSQLNIPSDQQEDALIKPKLINLKKVDQLDEYTLNNTLFFNLKILGYDHADEEINVLITSNNAAHMVLTLSIFDLGLQFKSLNELYNPLLGLRTLHWIGITDQYLMVSYYNQSSYFLTNGVYRRTEFKKLPMTNTFITLNTVSLPIDLANSFHLLVQDRIFQAQPAEAQKLALYDISQSFGIIGNYNDPGNFKDMTITGYNAFSQAEVTVSVSFDNGGDNTGGLKWYAILLIAVGCLLVIGLAVGFYFKNKAKKDKQKISLVTEGEEDEQV